MTTTNEHGPIVISAPANVSMSYDLKWSHPLSKNAKGTLVVTNETTGASKRYAIASLATGDTVWDWDVDDPSASIGDKMTFETNGTFGSGGAGLLAGWSPGSGTSVRYNVSGNGAGSGSGIDTVL